MTTFRASHYDDDDLDSGERSFDVGYFAHLLERDNTMRDDLHALKYGEQPRGLGWAWNAYENVRKSQVRINGELHEFDPLTRSVTKL